MKKDPDHYDTLGVDKEATSTEIKKAYRGKATKAHPDKGGSAEDMAHVNRAYAVLSNPVYRKSYDKGEPIGDEASPETLARSQVATLLVMCINEMIDKGADPNRLEIIKMMEQMCEDARSNMNEGMLKFEDRLKVIEVVQDRLKVEDETILHEALKAEVNDSRLGMKDIERQMEIADHIEAILEHYTYDAITREGIMGSRFSSASVSFGSNLGVAQPGE